MRALIPAAETGILTGMIRRIKFLGIPVKDQDRALDFYSQISISLTSSAGSSFRFQAPKQVLYSLPPEGREDRIGTRANTSWEVDNLDRTYEELTAKGVEFRSPPQKQPWGHFAIMKDSEGNQIVLSSR